MSTAARFWDGIAASYAQRAFPRPDATAKKLAIIRERLRAGTPMLDLGCATGPIPIELAGTGAEILAVDVSPAMIAIAERRASEAGVQNVTFRVADANEIDGFPPESFEVITAFNLLHLIEDPAALLATIHRLLRPGGVLITSTPCLGGVYFPPYMLILPFLRLIGRAPPITLLTADALHTALTEAGFSTINAHDVGDDPTNRFLVATR